MKISKESIHEKFSQIETKLNQSYNNPNKSRIFIDLAKLTILLPVFGIFYLWVLFDAFGISYFESFDITDSFSVLYQKLMHPILIILAFSTVLLFIAYPILFMGKEKRKTLSILFVLILLVFGIMSLWLLCNLNKFPLIITIIVIVFATIGALAYLFLHRNYGVLILISLVFWYLFINAQFDAKNIIQLRPSYTIKLKEHNELPILQINDRDRYLIYKTSTYYFIKNSKENLIYKYSITNGEQTIFTPYIPAK